MDNKKHFIIALLLVSIGSSSWGMDKVSLRKAKRCNPTKWQALEKDTVFSSPNPFARLAVDEKSEEPDCTSTPPISRLLMEQSRVPAREFENLVNDFEHKLGGSKTATRDIPDEDRKELGSSETQPKAKPLRSPKKEQISMLAVKQKKTPPSLPAKSHVPDKKRTSPPTPKRAAVSSDGEIERLLNEAADNIYWGLHDSVRATHLNNKTVSIEKLKKIVQKSKNIAMKECEFQLSRIKKNAAPNPTSRLTIMQAKLLNSKINIKYERFNSIIALMEGLGAKDVTFNKSSLTNYLDGSVYVISPLT